MKHNLDSVVTTILFSLLGLSGCVTVPKWLPASALDSNESKSSLGLPKSEDVFANPVTPLLQRSGGLALSPEGVLYFANHKKLGTIGKYELGKTKEPETFIDLSEWISASGDRDLRVEGLRLDEDNRLLVAEAGTGKLLRISPDARKLEILADSYDGYRSLPRSRIWPLDRMGICTLVHLIQGRSIVSGPMLVMLAYSTRILFGWRD